MTHATDPANSALLAHSWEISVSEKLELRAEHAVISNWSRTDVRDMGLVVDACLQDKTQTSLSVSPHRAAGKRNFRGRDARPERPNCLFQGNVTPHDHATRPATILEFVCDAMNDLGPDRDAHSLGFQANFDIRRERMAPRRLEARLDLARETFEQRCALLNALALKHPESVRVSSGNPAAHKVKILRALARPGAAIQERRPRHPVSPGQLDFSANLARLCREGARIVSRRFGSLEGGGGPDYVVFAECASHNLKADRHQRAGPSG
jgi:hypothetical protein